MSEQCQCLTKEGEGPQCRNKAKPGSLFCGRHQDCKHVVSSKEKPVGTMLPPKKSPPVSPKKKTVAKKSIQKIPSPSELKTTEYLEECKPLATNQVTPDIINEINNTKGTVDNPIPKNWKEFSVDEIPNTNAWLLTPLFKVDENNRWRIWQVGFDGKLNKITYSGLIDGKITPHEREVTTNQSGRDLQEQALLQARSDYYKKFREEGYRIAGQSLPNELEPMLANTWLPTVIKEEMDEEGVKKKSNQRELLPSDYPVAVEEKIDGIRMLFHIDERGEAKSSSRNNVSYDTLGHITSELAQFLVYLPCNSRLDGELWAKGKKFNEISGAVRRKEDSKTLARAKKRGENPLDVSEIKYFIFDILLVNDMPYEDRQDLLERAYARYTEDGHKANNFVILKPRIAKSEEEILTNFEGYTNSGYEGIMIRKLAGPKNKRTPKSIADSLYEHKRSSNLLKYKKFKEEEGTIIGVKEEKGTHKGAAKFVVRDPRGNVFDVAMASPLEERKKWLKNQKAIIGLPLTYRFQEESEYGVPRFPVGFAIRNYE